MRLLIALACVAVLFGFAFVSMGEATPQTKYVEVTVSTSRDWDENSAPDIKMHLSGPGLRKRRSGTFQNTYEATYKFNIGSYDGREATLDVYDGDMLKDEHMCSTTIRLSGGYSGGCGSHTQIRTQTYSR